MGGIKVLAVGNVYMPLVACPSLAFMIGISSLERPLVVAGNSATLSLRNYHAATQPAEKCFSIHYGLKDAMRVAPQRGKQESLFMANRSIQSKALHCFFLFFILLFILMPMASRLEAKVSKAAFGSTPDGTKVEIYTLEEGALKARIMTYGARLVSLEVPDRSGRPGDIVLGYESLAGYTADPKSYFGSIVGR
jgi:hypothetical protein